MSVKTKLFLLVSVGAIFVAGLSMYELVRAGDFSNIENQRIEQLLSGEITIPVPEDFERWP